MYKHGTKNTSGDARVGIIMGSDSDYPTMREAADILDLFGVEYELLVISAHRTPADMADYGSQAASRGLKVLIAGAGGAAHLPGMTASYTTLPVIGVPIKSRALKGLDSLMSIVQMPPGVPVATVAIGAGKNAGILAVQMLANHDAVLAARLAEYKTAMAEESRKKNNGLSDYSQS
jgi:5-(carboxyamino)imidazole ribonucleotide mutase